MVSRFYKYKCTEVNYFTLNSVYRCLTGINLLNHRGRDCLAIHYSCFLLLLGLQLDCISQLPLHLGVSARMWSEVICSTSTPGPLKLLHALEPSQLTRREMTPRANLGVTFLIRRLDPWIATWRNVQPRTSFRAANITTTALCTKRHLKVFKCLYTILPPSLLPSFLSMNWTSSTSF